MRTKNAQEASDDVELVLEFVPELQRFAARRLGDWGHAEDAVQETLLRAWRSADQFDPDRGTRRAWLYTILRNLLVDMARARSRRPHAVSIERAAPSAPGADDVDTLLTSLAVGAALRQLTIEQREVIDHCYFRARPHAEVARQLGLPVGTIRSRLFYARDALRRALVDLEFIPQPERQLT